MTKIEIAIHFIDGDVVYFYNGFDYTCESSQLIFWQNYIDDMIDETLKLYLSTIYVNGEYLICDKPTFPDKLFVIQTSAVKYITVSKAKTNPSRKMKND